MSRDDWFRHKTWNSRIEKRFFEKLSRARSQRDQYLAIQALTLAPSRPKAALNLIDHYFESRKDKFHDVRVFDAKVEALKALKDEDGVIEAYKTVLVEESNGYGLKTNADVKFPYLVATKKIRREYAFALEVLQSRQDDLAFPLTRFMWHASHALLAADQGDTVSAKKHAKEAVTAAEARRSGFRYHQNLGLVGKEHEAVVKKLIHIASQ